MFPTSNAPLHIQSLDSSELTDFDTCNVDIFNAEITPETSVTFRADQWILIEEALMQQASVQFAVSQRTYALNRFDQAGYTFDKATELEALAQKVGLAIESLQANKENK
jgi:hypothetical protein